MNCKLYQKECTQTGAPKPRASTRQSTDDSALDTMPIMVSNQNATLNSSASISDHSYFPRAQDTTYNPREHSEATGRTLANLESLSCKVPCSSYSTFKLTTKADDQPHHIPQLDDLFDSEVLRLNVPFHDFSFLGDAVNHAVDSLNERMPVGSVDPIDQQFVTPAPNPMSISPHGQPGDRVSGLDSERLESGPGESKSHIPPGLFIGVGELKSGFLGKWLPLW